MIGIIILAANAAERRTGWYGALIDKNNTVRPASRDSLGLIYPASREFYAILDRIERGETLMSEERLLNYPASELHCYHPPETSKGRYCSSCGADLYILNPNKQDVPKSEKCNSC